MQCTWLSNHWLITELIATAHSTCIVVFLSTAPHILLITPTLQMLFDYPHKGMCGRINGHHPGNQPQSRTSHSKPGMPAQPRPQQHTPHSFAPTMLWPCLPPQAITPIQSSTAVPYPYYKGTLSLCTPHTPTHHPHQKHQPLNPEPTPARTLPDSIIRSITNSSGSSTICLAVKGQPMNQPSASA